MYSSGWSKGGHQHLAAASVTTSNTRNHPAGVKSAGEHASAWAATKSPAGFWWAGEALLHLSSLHSPGACL